MNTAIAKSPTQLVKLKSRQEVAERTMAFHFEKPASFKFIPGQFIDMTLLTPLRRMLRETREASRSRVHLTKLRLW